MAHELGALLPWHEAVVPALQVQDVAELRLGRILTLIVDEGWPHILIRY